VDICWPVPPEAIFCKDTVNIEKGLVDSLLETVLTTSENSNRI